MTSTRSADVGFTGASPGRSRLVASDADNGGHPYAIITPARLAELRRCGRRHFCNKLPSGLMMVEQVRSRHSDSSADAAAMDNVRGFQRNLGRPRPERVT